MSAQISKEDLSASEKTWAPTGSLLMAAVEIDVVIHSGEKRQPGLREIN